MHELLLFAPVPASQHHGLLQQLSGLTAMQPIPTFERRLIFKPHRKPGSIKPRVGGSQNVQSSELQKIQKMLGGGLYYLQVVGGVNAADFGGGSGGGSDTSMGGTELGGSDRQAKPASGYVSSNQTWRMEFKDIPDAGTQSGVTSRLVSTAKLPYGDVLPGMTAWGFE